MKLTLQIVDPTIEISESPIIYLFIDGKQAITSHSVVKGDGMAIINITAGFRTPPKKKKK